MIVLRPTAFPMKEGWKRGIPADFCVFVGGYADELRVAAGFSERPETRRSEKCPHRRSANVNAISLWLGIKIIGAIARALLDGAF